MNEKTAYNMGQMDTMYYIGLKLAMDAAGITKEASKARMFQMAGRLFGRGGKSVAKGGKSVAQKAPAQLPSHISQSSRSGGLAMSTPASQVKSMPAKAMQSRVQSFEAASPFARQAQQMGSQAAKGAGGKPLTAWQSLKRGAGYTALGVGGLGAAGLIGAGMAGPSPYGAQPGNFQQGIRRPSMMHYNPQEYAQGYYGYQ